MSSSSALKKRKNISIHVKNKELEEKTIKPLKK